MTSESRGRRGGGSIYKRPDGRWQGQISLGHSGGKRKRVTVTGRTVGEVQQKMRELKNSADKGLPVLTSTPRLSEYLAVWLEGKRQKASPKTYKFYESIVRLHIVPDLGHIRIHKLTQHDINALLNRKIELATKAAAQRDNEHIDPGVKRIRFSKATVDAIRRTLRAALNSAQREDYVGRNVASLSDVVSVPKFEGKALTLTEASVFLSTIDGTRNEVLYRVALSLGLRQGEVLGLRWVDVDLEEGVLHVRLQLQRVDGVLQLRELKTVESRRTIPLPTRIATRLRNHRTKQKEERLQAGGRWQGHLWNLVFMTPLGTPIDDANLRKDFYKRLEDAGLERMRFHDLRHSAASFLGAQGVPVKEVQRILGHAQSDTTMRYTHAQLDNMRDAVERMDDIFHIQDETKNGS